MSRGLGWRVPRGSSYVFRTGGKVRAFAQALATRLAHRHSRRLTVAHALSARRGRVYVDLLRNALGVTAVRTWSTRARPGAPVAVPVRWDEVVGLGGGDRWTLRNIAPRLAHLDEDPWQGMGDAARSLPDLE